MMNGKTGKSGFLTAIFDTMFIMILCFLTLLSTMLVRGKVIVGSGSGAGMKHTFNLVTFLVTFIGLGVYLFYILPRSNKELGFMVSELYSNESDINDVMAHARDTEKGEGKQ